MLTALIMIGQQKKFKTNIRIKPKFWADTFDTFVKSYTLSEKLKSFDLPSNWPL